MENNINDKIRVNTYTKLDDSEEKLLDEVFWLLGRKEFGQRAHSHLAT